MKRLAWQARQASASDGERLQELSRANVPLSFERMARYVHDVVRADNALFLDGQASQLWGPPRGHMDNAVPIGLMIVVEMRDDGG